MTLPIIKLKSCLLDITTKLCKYQLPTDNDFQQFVKDERFASGFVCPHCVCVDHILRNSYIYKTDKAYMVWYERSHTTRKG